MPTYVNSHTFDLSEMAVLPPWWSPGSPDEHEEPTNESNSSLDARTNAQRTRSLDLKDPLARAGAFRARAWNTVRERRLQQQYDHDHPQPPSPVPLQWRTTNYLHDRSADTPITEGATETMLMGLDPESFYQRGLTSQQHAQRIAGRNFKPGYWDALVDAVRTILGRDPRDFGEFYGIVRPWMWMGIAEMRYHLLRRRNEEDKVRRDALRGEYISNARVPPRRIWDLQSNRVLPSYILPENWHVERRDMVWTVSHSWVRAEDRELIWTPINGFEWPVPIPKGTSLEHVCMELLDLGAEYVWLDILCLRQHSSRVEDEEKRVEEWKLDVPTIGFVYSLDAPCVTYFNGLGIPFDPSPEVVRSDRHWLNRVWTVQEATKEWVPGGLTGAESNDAREFFRTHLTQAIPKVRRQLVAHTVFAMRAMRGRHCSNELDRVHSLAYILRCETLPIYDERMPLELAWQMLLKHLYPYILHLLVVQHAAHHPDDPQVLPSWKHFLRLEIQDEDAGADWLYLADKSDLGVVAPGTYIQRVHALGPLRMSRKDKTGESEVVQLICADRSISYFINCRMGGHLDADTEYRLLKVSQKSWIVVEEIGRREARVLDEDDEQQTKRETALEVIKRGCVLLRGNPRALPRHEMVTVVYVA